MIPRPEKAKISKERLAVWIHWQVNRSLCKTIKEKVSSPSIEEIRRKNSLSWPYFHWKWSIQKKKKQNTYMKSIQPSCLNRSNRWKYHSIDGTNGLKQDSLILSKLMKSNKRSCAHRNKNPRRIHSFKSACHHKMTTQHLHLRGIALSKETKVMEVAVSEFSIRFTTI